MPLLAPPAGPPRRAVPTSRPPSRRCWAATGSPPRAPPRPPVGGRRPRPGRPPPPRLAPDHGRGGRPPRHHAVHAGRGGRPDRPARRGPAVTVGASPAAVRRPPPPL